MIIKWKLGSRVRIIDHDGAFWWNGRSGKVVRVCVRNGCAWLDMDDPLPADKRVFHADDERANHTRVYMDECEEIVPPVQA